MNPLFVFVYGTLKTGFRNNYRLTRGGSVSRGRAVLYDSPFVLLNWSQFPAAVKTSEGQKKHLMRKGVSFDIVGELFPITDAILADLDRLEGYPQGYDRAVVTVNYGPEHSQQANAWMYYIKRGIYDGADLCADGEWWPPVQNVRYIRATPARERR